MDIITNFHATTDVIDLTGLGKTLKTIGAITGTTVAAGSVGWQSSGGNTFVYVNTGASAASLGKASMAIELNGGIALATSNILHV
jgi:hypothetical protein